MPSAEIQILRCADRDLIDCLCRFRDRDQTNSSFKTTFTYLSNANTKFDVASNELLTNPTIEFFRNTTCRVFQSVMVECSSGTFTIRRHGQNGQTDNDKPFDSASISTPDNASNRGESDQKLSQLVASVQEAFGHLPIASLGSFLGESAKQHFEARDVALARLESLVAKYVGDLEDARKRHDADVTKKQQELESTFHAKDAELDQWRRVEAEKLKSQSDKLDERAKSLNLQEPKTERRRVFDVLEKTLGDWDKSFKLSDGPATRRVSTHILIIVMTAFCAGWVVFFFSRAMATGLQTSELAFFYIRAGVLLILTVSFATYYLRWMNAWQHKHAEEEFRLKRMQLDLKRAHWFVELAFQWKDEFKESVPAEMVDRLTRHLFEEAAAETKPKTKLDSLAASLLGVGSKLTVSPTGPQLEIGSQGLKALAKELVREMNGK